MSDELEAIFAGTRRADIEPEERESEIESSEEEKPKKRRGRPPGSGKKKAERPSIEIDRRIVSQFANLAFGIVVSVAGNNWRPLDNEVESISSNLALVLEKRLPDAAIENLPEYALGLAVITYVGRCYVQSQFAGSSDSKAG